MSAKLGIAPVGGLSHVRGVETPALSPLTIPGLLARAVRKFGDVEAAVFCADGRRRTYASMAGRVDRLAAGLLSLGLYKGDRVGIWAPNAPEWVLAQFATARIGLILVNINPAYRVSELEYALNKVGAKALITATRFKSSDYVGMLRDLAPELATARKGQLRAKRLPALRTVIQFGEAPGPGVYSFDEVMERGGAAHRDRLNAITEGLSEHDPINIQFTSGTTGAPKGATLTHHNIVNNARYCARAMRLTPEDRLCIPVPLYHCFGMVLGNLVCVSAGATMVFPGEGFDALATLKALDTEHCTAVHGVPTMFAAMLSHPEFRKFNLNSLRTGIMSGAPCPEPLMRRVMNDMGANQITIAYGMTETSPISFQTDVEDSVANRCTTVGRVQPHAEVKIVGEDGNIAPIGEKGELMTRGYCVMRGYWDDATRSADAIDAEGWMHTGDLATLDADGYCRVVGRVKDMLIRGGENIYPAEIEEYLLRHPDIAAAQVFGLPDPRYGETVCAWITPRPGSRLTEADVVAHCQGQIAHFKVPTTIRFVADFPMTVTGKPQKFVMREKMIAELGLTPD
jgi:fatty-acyl-CoA synthase